MAMLVTNKRVPMTYAMERKCIYIFLYMKALTGQLASPYFSSSDGESDGGADRTSGLFNTSFITCIMLITL